MRKSLLPLLFLGFAGSCFAAIEDTPANRMAEAERFMQAFALEQALPGIVTHLAKTIPEGQRPQFLALAKNLDASAINDAMQENMVQLFTADELHALVDFQQSPTGKSAMRKMAPYLSALLPTLQAEIQKARLKDRQAPAAE